METPDLYRLQNITDMANSSPTSSSAKYAHLGRLLTVTSIAMVDHCPHLHFRNKSLQAKHYMQPKALHDSHMLMEKFCKRVMSMTRLSSQCVFLAMYYLAELISHPVPEFFPETNSVNTRIKPILFAPHSAIFDIVPLEWIMATVSLMLADIYLNDATFTVSSWSQATGIPASVLVLVQRDALTALDHNLNVQFPSFETWTQTHLPMWVRQGIDLVQSCNEQSRAAMTTPIPPINTKFSAFASPVTPSSLSFSVTGQVYTQRHDTPPISPMHRGPSPAPNGSMSAYSSPSLMAWNPDTPPTSPFGRLRTPTPDDRLFMSQSRMNPNVNSTGSIAHPRLSALVQESGVSSSQTPSIAGLGVLPFPAGRLTPDQVACLPSAQFAQMDESYRRRSVNATDTPRSKSRMAPYGSSKGVIPPPIVTSHGVSYSIPAEGRMNRSASAHPDMHGYRHQRNASLTQMTTKQWYPSFSHGQVYPQIQEQVEEVIGVAHPRAVASRPISFMDLQL